MAGGAAIGMLSSLLGLYLSYYGDIASGPAIVLVETLIFTLVLAVVSRRKLRWLKARPVREGN